MQGPRSEPPIPIFTTCLMARPVYPFQEPVLTASEKSLMFSRTSNTPGMTSLPSSITGSPERFRRAVWSTARFSVPFIFSPRNILSVFMLKSARFRQPHKQLDRPIRNPVFGIIEIEPAGRYRKFFGPVRVGREKLAQGFPAYLLVVLPERLPFFHIRQTVPCHTNPRLKSSTYLFKIVYSRIALVKNYSRYHGAGTRRRYRPGSRIRTPAFFLQMSFPWATMSAWYSLYPASRPLKLR